MFEDALLESSGRIRTHYGWLSGIAAVLNGGILCLLMLLPLLHIASLPKQALDTLIAAPAPPVAPLAHLPQAVAMVQPVTRVNPFAAPVRIPTNIPDRQDAPAASIDGFSNPLAQQGEGLPAGIENSMGTTLPQVQAVPVKKLAISSGVMAGNKISGSAPQYPAVAQMAHIQGTVVLAATISKNGTIENLRLISGPAMLVAAASQAVRTWRYKPYLLNGEPVEVETTINIVFNLGS